MIWDKNDIAIFDGCIIDLHQTVNGCNLFYVKTVLPLDIRYEYDHERKYEYDKDDLLKPCRYSGEVDFEITNLHAPPQGLPNPTIFTARLWRGRGSGLLGYD